MGEPDDLELTALMCSRLCHDLISPVGAIANGFEVLDEEHDDSMRQMALDVIRTNGRKASARLQFARLAFGAMGSGGDQFPIDEASRLTMGLLEGEKVSVRFAEGPAALPKDVVKLLVNLVVIATQAIPRGGEVLVEFVQGSDGFRLTARGVNAIVPRVAQSIFEGNPPDGRIDAHNIQPYYTKRLARAVGAQVAFHPDEGVVVITAERAG